MRHNTNKNSFRLFALATAFIVMALVSHAEARQTVLTAPIPSGSNVSAK